MRISSKAHHTAELAESRHRCSAAQRYPQNQIHTHGPPSRFTTMRKVEVHGGAMFRCPKCQRPNYCREINIDNAGDVPVPGTPGFYGGETTWPDDFDTCKRCGYVLTDQQIESARPMAAGGGCMLPAWWFTCENCGRDQFLETTIYYGNGASGPPNSCRCQHCGRKFRVGSLAGGDS